MSYEVCLGVLNEISPAFRPYIQCVYQDLKLGKLFDLNLIHHNSCVQNNDASV